mgnify:CR=1 FL=1
MRIPLANFFKGDKVIWMIFFLLCVISVMEVFSSSSMLVYGENNYWGPLTKHALILLGGIFCTIIVQNIDCKYFKIATPFLLLLSIITLTWVLVAGQSTNGASRWVGFLGIQFQPSEIAKGAIVLSTAQILSALQTENGTEKNTFKYICTATLPIVGLILLENLSTAILILIVVVEMMFYGRVSGKILRRIVVGSIITVVVLVGLVFLVGKDAPVANDKQNLTERYQSPTKGESDAKADSTSIFDDLFHRAGTWKKRIIRFVSSEDIPPGEFDLDKDAQIGYSNIAIASSEFVGKGPGNSEARDFLPQSFSDFIYAIIIEEMGLFGAILVMSLYIFLLFRAGRIADRCENAFPAFLIMGIALMLVTQAMFNMMVAVGLAPVTGQPLPLISKGGTSTIINCIYIGTMLSVSISAKKKPAK